jgi:hypothetical protein
MRHQMGIDGETEAYRAYTAPFDASTQPTRREGLAIAFLTLVGPRLLTRSSVMSGKTICLGCRFHLRVLHEGKSGESRNAM